MKSSIKTKTLVLILTAMILLACSLCISSIIAIDSLTDDYGHQSLSLMCDKKAAELNCVLVPLERSVDYMSINALEELTNTMNLKDEIYYENYVDKMRSILDNTSNHTDGCIAVYLRFRPDICSSTSGILLTRDSLDMPMKSVSPTDILAYDKNDIEYVGWYYQPIEAGQPLWMQPYYNRNIDVYMISYVVPLTKNGEFIGVLGMDINFEYIIDQVANIKVYESGYAYITDENNNVIYHPDLSYGDMVTINNDCWVSSSRLNNGMILNITAPFAEITASRNRLILQMTISAIIIIFLIAIITFYFSNRMIAPLNKLTHIANEIASGNYDVDFNFDRPNDEIGQLTKSFEHTVTTLKDYMSYINGLAYKDALTNVRNRLAYDDQIGYIEESLRNGEKVSFVIAVFDVNNLKRVNDDLGHEKGDILIKEACKLICRTFSHSAVFRIGGDEFAAIIKDTSDEKIDTLFTGFLSEMKKTWNNTEQEKRISIAYGYSRYNSETDNCVTERAFERADKIMYENKKKMKKGQDS